jgi:hypothetical protein
VHKSVEQVVLIPRKPCRLMADADGIRKNVEDADAARPSVEMPSPPPLRLHAANQ